MTRVSLSGKWGALFLTFLMVISLLSLRVDVAQASSDFTYTKAHGQVIITNYSGPGGKVVIPAKLGGLPVTEIGSWAFHNKGITSLIIPDSVTSIGDTAFFDNQLTSVTIGGKVTGIGHAAFAFNQLTELIIGESVVSINGQAFHCNLLTSVTIPNSVTSIGDHAFADNKLTSITIPKSVTSIGQYAFTENNLASATILNNTASIGMEAFGNISGSAGFEEIDKSLIMYGFSGSTAEAYAISMGLTFGAIKEFEDFTCTLVDGKATITDYTGAGAELVIPAELDGNPVTGIADHAFINHQLTSVTIPASVASIGVWAFENIQRDPAELTIYGIAGSAAEAYANENGHTFVKISKSLPPLVYLLIGLGLVTLAGAAFALWKKRKLRTERV